LFSLFRAKSAMAEILVSDLCDRRPAATRRRVFAAARKRGPDSVASLEVESRPRFSLFPLLFSLFFSLYLRLFSIVFAQACFSPPFQCLAL
jgi:hypothetical protein